ncbi:hypothetical protein As57867_016672, partial [Aphanomyces stellatus]
MTGHRRWLSCLLLLHFRAHAIDPPPGSPLAVSIFIGSVNSSLAAVPLNPAALAVQLPTSTLFILDNPFDPSSRTNGTLLIPTSVLPIQSVMTISRNQVFAATRASLKAPNSAVLVCDINHTVLGTCLVVRPGENVSDLGSLDLTQRIPIIDIPDDVVVEAFQYPNFRGQRVVRNATSPLVPSNGLYGWAAVNPGSLRVWSALTKATDDQLSIMAPLPRHTDITMYGSVSPTAQPLSIQVGASVPSLVVLLDFFPFFVFAVDIPLGLIIYGFDQPGYRGHVTPFLPHLYDTVYTNSISSLQSFKVRTANDPAPQSQPRPPTDTASCRYENAPPTAPLVEFTVGVDYLLLHPRTCNEAFHIPDGITIIGYDRPWLLGSSQIWTSNSSDEIAFWPWIYRLRSLQVVRTNEIPGHTERLSDNDHVRLFFYDLVGHDITFSIFRVGDAIPGLANWEAPVSTISGIHIHVPPSMVLLLYADFNFQGQKRIYRPNDSSNVLDNPFGRYKSVRVLHPSDWNASDEYTSPFVGFYTPWTNHTPVFLQPNDTIRAFVFPWIGSIVKLTVPNGTVAMGFTETDFGGHCQLWATDTTLLAPWNQSIRSIQAWHATDPRANCTFPSSTTFSPATAIVLSIASALAVSLCVTTAILLRFKQRHAQNTPKAKFDCLNWGDMDLLRLYKPSIHVIAHLATGANGFVSLAIFHGQQVAVKTMHSTSPTGPQVQKFIDEIQFLGGLKSPYIVTLIGAAWTHPTNLQCVMEYMNRGDLRHVLAHTTSPANWPWSAKLDVAHSVAQALFYLHSQQMIHRDLKSRNVLLDSKKGTKLADFGTSKQHVYEGDSMTAGVGTFRWMAPEMLLFQPYSNAVDVYSFGVLLSELATHTLPYA